MVLSIIKPKLQDCPAQLTEGAGTIPGWLFPTAERIQGWWSWVKCWVLSLNLDHRLHLASRWKTNGTSARGGNEKVIARDETWERWPLLQAELKYSVLSEHVLILT